MPARPYVLAETTWKAVKNTRFDVCVLPWGATEAHNYHLPYGTDTIQCDRIGERATGAAWERGAKVVLLPSLPFGVQTGQLDIPLCINLNPSTQAAILRDIVQSLEAHGVQKLVILNGHGGNDFRQMIRELQPRTPIFLCQVNWYAAIDAAAYFDEPGDHGGELETSVMLYVAPELVGPLSDAGPGSARKPRLRALRDGWAWAPRRWSQISRDTGVGDPSRSTAEKGARYIDALTAALSDFLVELAAMESQSLYE